MIRALLRLAFERLRAKRCPIVLVHVKTELYPSAMGEVARRCNRWDGHHGKHRDENGEW